MKVKRYFGKDMRQALTEITQDLGPDAAILSNTKLDNGVEIIAAIDYDDAILDKTQPTKSSAESVPVSSDSGPTSGQDNSIDFDLEEVTLTPPAPSNDQPGKENEALTLIDYQVENLKEPLDFSAMETMAANKSRLHASQFIEACDIDDMKNEIMRLRQLIEKRISSGASTTKTIRHNLIDYLTGLGLDNSICQNIATLGASVSDVSKARKLALNMLSKKVKTINSNTVLKKGIYACLGASGVGKTTTIAKLAALHAITYGPESVAIVSSDNYRIASHEQLNVYGRILGCETYTVDEQSMLPTLQRLANKNLVLIDTAGVSQRDQRVVEQFQTFYQQNLPIRSFLVLSATSQRLVMGESLKIFAKFPLFGCIITKMDEAKSLGEVISTVIKHELAVAFTTNGQKIPEDIQRADAKYLVELAQEAGVVTDDEWPAQLAT